MDCQNGHKVYLKLHSYQQMKFSYSHNKFRYIFENITHVSLKRKYIHNSETCREKLKSILAIGNRIEKSFESRQDVRVETTIHARVIEKV